MSTRYAIRITEENLAEIRALHPAVDIDVKEDRNRYFLYTFESDGRTTEHDVVAEEDLAIYDGTNASTRTILQ